MLPPLSVRSPDAYYIRRRRILEQSMSTKSGVLWGLGVALLTIVKIKNLCLSLVCNLIGGYC